MHFLNPGLQSQRLDVEGRDNILTVVYSAESLICTSGSYLALKGLLFRQKNKQEAWPVQFSVCPLLDYFLYSLSTHFMLTLLVLRLKGETDKVPPFLRVLSRQSFSM